MALVDEDLGGMSFTEAKAYVAAHLASLSLTRKKIGDLDADVSKWEARVQLARAHGDPALESAAEAELERIKATRTKLATEAQDLEASAQRMRRALPGTAARERSVDPDLLEQELLMAAGHLPGEEDEVATERKLDALENAQRVDDALAALKAKMGIDHSEPGK